MEKGMKGGTDDIEKFNKHIMNDFIADVARVTRPRWLILETSGENIYEMTTQQVSEHRELCSRWLSIYDSVLEVQQ